MAEDTGGIAVVNTNDIDAGFARIVRDNSSYYLLGYSPAIEHDDGRFREIEVRVRRPGVSVRARRGYFASEAARATPAPLPVMLSAAEEAVAALGDRGRRSALHLRTSVGTTAGASGAGILVLHALGMVFTVGVGIAVDLRVLGGGSARLLLLQ